MSDTAVLVIDMFNDYRHRDAKQLGDNVASIIDPLAGLISAADERDNVDLIYVNDNHGDFTADHRAIISAALEGERPDLVEPLLPPPDCPMVAKVRHSVFLFHCAGLLAGSAEDSAHRIDRTGHRAMRPGRLSAPL